MQVKELENVEYLEEESTADIARYTTNSWALDRIDQRGSDLDGIYDPGPGRDGEGVDIYIIDTGWNLLQYKYVSFTAYKPSYYKNFYKI